MDRDPRFTIRRTAIVSSPLHRDPASDGPDYGADDEPTNRQIHELVTRLLDRIEAGARLSLDDFMMTPLDRSANAPILSGESLVRAIRDGLEAIEGATTDTIVKENVRNALALGASDAGLKVDWDQLYGR